MRVYLVGFMATGKTTIGERLAPLLRASFRDLDAEIERSEGRSVEEIFHLQGEETFRGLERSVLRESAMETELVMATGGGTFCDPENRQWIGEHGVSVWLDLPFAEIGRRLEAPGAASRPLFTDRVAAKSLFAARRSDYARADLRQRLVGREDAGEVAETLAKRLREMSCEQ